MRLFTRITQLVCGAVLIVAGFSSEGLMAVGICGIIIVLFAIWDIHREMNPDKKLVADLDEKSSSLNDGESKKDE